VNSPAITIFVRHTAGCKYEADEFSRRCNCRKSLRWYRGRLHVKSAQTRSWEQAEVMKRSLIDQFEGRKPDTTAKDKPLEEAIAVFVKEKITEGLSDDVVKKYKRLLNRLQSFCEARSIYTVQGITRDLITEFCAEWPELYPSSSTRVKLRERLRSFLRYCYEAQWLERIPPVTKFQMVETETQPLEPEEYERLLEAVDRAIQGGDPRRQTTKNCGRRDFEEEGHLCLTVRAFLQTMRWTGLAIRDALTLRRDALQYDEAKDLWRVTTKRSKTGTPVSNPIPSAVAAEMISAHALNSNPSYFFWSGNGKPQSATSNWGQRYIAPVFKAAGIESDGHLVSHRLRDTFAVDLLSKGVPMEEVSKLLAHTSIRTTEKHYAKWSIGRQDRLDSLVQQTWASPKTSGRPKKARRKADV
jgi:site-specific recombinase XerD